jgi:hypothetical protein
MHHLLAPWAWHAAAWAALTFVALVASAIVGLRQVFEARGLRKAQTRPFVVVDFHPWQTFVDIEITNLGSTLATDVAFEFNPPLQSTMDGDARGTFRELNLFRNGIPTLPPGKKIVVLFDQFPSRLQANLPLTFGAIVSYRGPDGEKYRDEITLDLAMYVGTGTITQHGLHEIHRELKAMADAMKRWTEFEGLKVTTRADRRERDAEMLARRVERFAARRADGDEVTDPNE